jgi:thiol-disulfide isomerase/thioredoxin
MSDTPAVLAGRPVLHIVERASSNGASVTLNVYLDKETGLPKRVAEDVDQNGTSFEPLREDFTSITVGQSPLVASNFAWAPPAGASVFAPPPSQEDSDKPALASGADAPDFAAQTPDGKDVHLSDFKGKVVVLDFWATWCGPCQMALPYTDKIAQTYTPKGVVFLPICSGDTKDAFQKWLGTHKAMFMHFYFDPPDAGGKGNVIGDLYKIQAIPTQYVIGKDGKVIDGFVGYDSQGDPNEVALKSAIDKALSAS